MQVQVVLMENKYIPIFRVGTIEHLKLFLVLTILMLSIFGHWDAFFVSCSWDILYFLDKINLNKF